jgi:hypothetical protein
MRPPVLVIIIVVIVVIIIIIIIILSFKAAYSAQPQVQRQQAFSKSKCVASDRRHDIIARIAPCALLLPLPNHLVQHLQDNYGLGPSTAKALAALLTDSKSIQVGAVCTSNTSRHDDIPSAVYKRSMCVDTTSNVVH